MQTVNTQEYFIDVERVEAVAGNLDAWLRSYKSEPPMELATTP